MGSWHSIRLVSLMTVLTLLSLSRGLRVISTPSQGGLPGRVEVTNSSVKSHDQFTLCGRVRTFQFVGKTFQSIISLGNSDILEAYVALSKHDHYKTRIRGWNYKKVFGTFISGSVRHFYPSWQPGTWVTVCVSVSKTDRTMAVNINSATVVSTDN